MLKNFRIEKYNGEYIIANFNNTRLEEHDIINKGFKTEQEALSYLEKSYEIENYNSTSFELYHKKKYRDIQYLTVTCIKGIELTTEELCEKIKKIVGYVPSVIKHYRGRRDGDFYREEYLWENSVRDGSYLIDDNGNVTLS